MPLTEARKQGLNHRIVLVALRDASGRLCLQRRAETKDVYPGRWDLSATGHVQAGESREEAARRELKEELGIDAVRLTRSVSLAASPKTGNASITLYFAGPCHTAPTPDPAEVSEVMFVDGDELSGLIEQFRSMFTPALLWVANEGHLFKPEPTGGC